MKTHKKRVNSGVILVLFMAIILMLSGCGPSSNQINQENKSKKSEEENTQKEEIVANENKDKVELRFL